MTASLYAVDMPFRGKMAQGIIANSFRGDWEVTGFAKIMMDVLAERRDVPRGNHATVKNAKGVSYFARKVTVLAAMDSA